MAELTTLKANDYPQAITIIESADLADSTKRKYTVLDAYLVDERQLTDRQALANYAQGLSKTGKAHLKAAVRLWSNAMIDSWSAAADGQGLVLRSVDKGRQIGDCLNGVGLFRVVRKYGRLIGKPELAPHDLRRTYAQIGYENGIPITQISKLLGHSSITTTQRYLNLDLNLETTISDFVPL